MLSNGPRPFSLYRAVFGIARAATKARRAWFEDVLANFDLWDLAAPPFAKFASVSLLSEFAVRFAAKSYFRQFAARMPHPSADARRLLARIAWIRFDSSDAAFLLDEITREKDPTPWLWLAIEIAPRVADLAVSVSPVLVHVRSECIEIAMLAIRAVHALSGQTFYHRIPALRERIFAGGSLFHVLEEAVSETPDLFALTCALSLEDETISITRIPERVTHAPLWFYFPLLLFLRSPIDVQFRLGTFIASNATEPDIHTIFAAIWLLTVNGDPAPVHFLMHCFVDSARDASPERVAILVLYMAAAAFMRLSVGPFPSVLPDAFRSSPFGAFDAQEEQKTGPADRRCYSFFLDIQMDGGVLRLGGLLAEASSLAEGYEDVPTPGLPDISDTYTCQEICQAISFFPWNGRDDLSVDQVARFGDILEWMRAVLNYQYSQQINKLVFAAESEPGGESVSLEVTKRTPLPGLTGRFAREPLVAGGCPFSVYRNRKPGRVSGGRAFQGEVRWIQFDTTVPVTISVESQAFVFKSQFKTNRFPYGDVRELVCLNDRKVHFLFDNLVGVLSFPPEWMDAFLAQCRILRFPQARYLLLANEVPDIGDVIEDWRKRRTTSFEFLLFLNLFSGRTFADPSLYPVFPPPVPQFGTWTDRSMPSLDGTFIGNDRPPDRRFETKLVVLPEWYFFADICGSVHEVYQNRKQLESRDDLPVWIDAVFGSREFVDRSLLSGAMRQREGFRPVPCNGTELIGTLESEIIFAAPFKSRPGSVDFGCVAADGDFFLVTVDLGNETPVMSVESPVGRLDDPLTHRFFAWAHSRSVVASKGLALTLLTPAGLMTRTSPWWPDLVFSERVAQTEPTVLSKLLVTAGNFQFVQVLACRERFGCFVASSRFGVTAVACNDGMLRIRSNRNGLKLATVSLGHDIAEHLLITKKWGFVVVKTPNEFQVFTSSGIFVNRSANSATVKNWECFRSYDGFDFVAYDDGHGKLWYFEAVDPGRLESIDIGTDVCAFKFQWRAGRFVVLSRNGTIRFHALHTG
jgi:hypothetical protein